MKTFEFNGYTKELDPLSISFLERLDESEEYAKAKDLEVQKELETLNLSPLKASIHRLKAQIDIYTKHINTVLDDDTACNQMFGEELDSVAPVLEAISELNIFISSGSEELIELDERTNKKIAEVGNRAERRAKEAASKLGNDGKPKQINNTPTATGK